MRGEQTESGAEQAVSSVAERREAERMARKNDEEVWRSRETGVQLRKVLLARKLVKKVGHEEEVKLLPIEVSKGEGRGVVITVTEGEELDDVEVGVSVSVDEESEVVVDKDSEVECESEEDVDVDSEAELEVPSPKMSCLRSNQFKGAALVSKCISPLASNSLKWSESSARSTKETSYADVHDTRARANIRSDMVIESRSIGRLLPGLGL